MVTHLLLCHYFTMEQQLMLDQLAKQLGELLSTQKLSLCTAESCTGGWLATTITGIAGSSTWFERGFVTYSNPSKQELLGVKQSTLDQVGAVSKEVAEEMAQGALANSHAQMSLAITGIAGPSSDNSDKPVGTVWLAWVNQHRKIQSQCFHFSGDRYSVRFSSVKMALTILINEVQPNEAQRP